MEKKAIQDLYPDNLSHCYGCGRLNEYGLHIKSYADEDEAVCTFEPRPYHIAIPGYVNGGVIASVIDCHCVGTAAMAQAREQRGSGKDNRPVRCMTASLHVDYVRPTPLGTPLEVRARVKEVKGRKVVVTATLSARGQICACGEVVAVRVPEHLAGKED